MTRVYFTLVLGAVLLAGALSVVLPSTLDGSYTSEWSDAPSYSGYSGPIARAASCCADRRGHATRFGDRGAGAAERAADRWGYLSTTALDGHAVLKARNVSTRLRRGFAVASSCTSTEGRQMEAPVAS